MASFEAAVGAVREERILRPVLADDPAKRAIDLFLACLCIALFAPLMVLIYCLVRLDDGPAFFTHERIGRDGRSFNCMKFRTMVVDAEKALAELLDRDADARAEWRKDFKLTHDPRVTRLGRLLRKSSLDELPQLFNVLRGEMSMVGPRPIVPSEVPRYGRRIEFYYRCRPGITGLWQVSGRNGVTYRRRVALDEIYVRRWRLALDFIVLFRTGWVVLLARGAS